MKTIVPDVACWLLDTCALAAGNTGSIRKYVHSMMPVDGWNTTSVGGGGKCACPRWCVNESLSELSIGSSKMDDEAYPQDFRGPSRHLMQKMASHGRDRDVFAAVATPPYPFLTTL
ncbi:hypothetical protein BKA70DRAFT_1449131 [Coprinopsis sp. MPI-PUGE-AT-0042]|nr:hypothetical protein BKA70DRAFT_1449131 [Coprinopsis sp. MPI-PUGE-AT-0042]